MFVNTASQYDAACAGFVIAPGVGMQQPSSAAGVVVVGLQSVSHTHPGSDVHFWPVGSLGWLYVM